MENIQKAALGVILLVAAALGLFLFSQPAGYPEVGAGGGTYLDVKDGFSTKLQNEVSVSDEPLFVDIVSNGASYQYYWLEFKSPKTVKSALALADIKSNQKSKIKGVSLLMVTEVVRYNRTWNETECNTTQKEYCWNETIWHDNCTTTLKNGTEYQHLENCSNITREYPWGNETVWECHPYTVPYIVYWNETACKTYTTTSEKCEMRPHEDCKNVTKSEGRLNITYIPAAEANTTKSRQYLINMTATPFLSFSWNSTNKDIEFDPDTDACGTLSSAGTTYTLNQSVSINNATCFTVTAAHVTLDCAGFSITGSNDTVTYAVYSNQLNTTVRNCNISNFQYGVWFSGATGSLATANNLSTTYTSGAGVRFDNGANNTASYNNITATTGSGGGGLFSLGCTNTTFTNNNVSATGNGVFFWSGSLSSLVAGNNISAYGSNGHGIFMQGGSGSGSILANNTIFSNASNGIYMQSGSDNFTIYGNTVNASNSGIYTAGSNEYAYNNTVNSFGSGNGMRVDGGSNTTFFNNTVSNTGTSHGYGITAGGNATIDCNGKNVVGVNASSTYGVYSTQFNTTVRNCNISNFQYGIYFNGATNGTINNTNASTTTASGESIYLNAASNNLISNVRGTSTTYRGINLRVGSNNNTVRDSYGFGTSRGIYADTTSNNTFINCTGNSTDGSGIELDTSAGCTLVNSTGASSSGYGIKITASSHNTNLTGTIGNSTSSSAIYINGGSNVSIDCQGRSIVGTNTSSTIGIYSNQFNTTVRNCNISNFENAIHFSGATNGTIRNTTTATSKNDRYVIYFVSSANYNTVVNSTLTATGTARGTASSSSHFNTFANVSIYSPTIGLYVDTANNTTVSGSYISGGAYAALLTYDAKHSTIANNTINATDTEAIDMQNTDTNNTFINNTLLSPSNTLMLLAAGAGGNTFHWNNFTATSSYYVQDLNGSNYYNTSEGNIYANVLDRSISVYGNVSSTGYPTLYIGTHGAGRPYNSTTSGSKVSGSTDYFPLTDQNLAENLTIVNITFTIPMNGTHVYVLDFNRSGTYPANASFLPSAASPLNSTLTTRQAPNGLLYTEVNSNDYFDRQVKNYFGVQVLPPVFRRYYGIHFMLTGNAGENITLSINTTAKMRALTTSWSTPISTGSLMLTYGSLYGGQIDYNASRKDIPVYVVGS